MKMFNKYIFTTLLAVILGISMATSGSALTLTVGSEWNWSNQTIRIPIKVDNPDKIAGAAFTITYDNNIILNTVESTFFDTFANQWASLDPVPDPVPPSSVEVDGTVYDQPLITNTITGGMRIAAARCTPAKAGDDPTLFTLTFSLKTGGTPGKHTVDVVATNLNNEAAGYDPNGEDIDMIIGADLLISNSTDPAAFPVLLASTANPEAGVITFEIDNDKDNMGDFWEEEFFGTIDAKDGTADSDHDGYSDFQEFANETDPHVQNPPNGDGYNKDTDNRLKKKSINGAIMILLSE